MKNVSNYAVASVILSAISLLAGPVFAIPGIVLGHMAVRQIKKSETEQGLGLVRTGLVMGYCGLIIWVLSLIVFVLVLMHIHK